METIFVSSLNIKNIEKQRTDCILFEYNNKRYLLFDKCQEKEKIINDYFKKDVQVIYFGGQNELRVLIDFGIFFNTRILPIDVRTRQWNNDTTKTNQSLLDILEEIKVIDSEQRADIELFSVYAYKHVVSGFFEINEATGPLMHLNARRIMYGIKSLYNINYNNRYCDIIDDELSFSLLEIENNRSFLDVMYIKKLRTELNLRIEGVLNDIYSISGKKFNINSPREINYILNELGVRTESIKKNDLESCYSQTGMVIFKLIDTYRKYVMYNDQYIKPLYESAITNGFGRFKYKMTSVPCLTQGHFCFIKDKGIVDISKVNQNDLIWTEFGFKKVLWSNSYKTKELTRVDFSNGLSVIGTNHHPILVNDIRSNSISHRINRKWVSLENLFVGESVICNYAYNNLKFGCNSYYSSYGKIISNILNTYASFDEKDRYIKLKNIQFSHLMTFEMFKAHCEFVGLKFWCFKHGTKHEYYDIVFYDETSLLNFYNSFKQYLSKNIQKIIEIYISVLKSKNFQYEHQNNKHTGYFNSLYEETMVVSIKKLEDEMTVYDLEVEDVHEYNANGIINHNTGRLSSSRATNENSFFTKLNIQSVPKLLSENINIRKCFLPSKDCDWCCIDFKAQEMRLASFLYGLEKIKNIPLNEDIYNVLSNELDLFVGSVASKNERRNISKIICLGMIYGLSNYGIIKQLKAFDIECDEGHDFRKSFYEIFPELKIGQERTLEYAHSVNGIYTISGRFRRINFSQNDKKNLMSRNNRIALNTVIQGACGDIMRIVLNRVEKEIMPCYKQYGFALLSTIHDEINLSVPKDKRLSDDILDKVLSITKNPVIQFQDLQFGCSVSFGKSWGELSPVS